MQKQAKREARKQGSASDDTAPADVPPSDPAERADAADEDVAPSE